MQKFLSKNSCINTQKQEKKNYFETMLFAPNNSCKHEI